MKIKGFMNPDVLLSKSQRIKNVSVVTLFLTVCLLGTAYSMSTNMAMYVLAR